MYLKALIYVAITTTISSCASVREDRVLSENYLEIECTGNLICELSENIVKLRRVREVTAGIARNYAGTLRPGCEPSNGSYICATEEYVVRKDRVSETQTTILMSRVVDGYDSGRRIIDLGNCKVIMTAPNKNLAYLEIDKVYNFSEVSIDETSIANRTGGLLEDYTEATLSCQNDCNYEVASDTSSNSIKLLLSEDKTSGSLSPAQQKERFSSISKLFEECKNPLVINGSNRRGTLQWKE